MFTLAEPKRLLTGLPINLRFNSSSTTDTSICIQFTDYQRNYLQRNLVVERADRVTMAKFVSDESCRFETHEEQVPSLHRYSDTISLMLQLASICQQIPGYRSRTASSESLFRIIIIFCNLIASTQWWTITLKLGPVMKRQGQVSPSLNALLTPRKNSSGLQDLLLAGCITGGAIQLHDGWRIRKSGAVSG
jgi:hypothetical protein